MKNILLLLGFLILSSKLYAQKESFYTATWKVKELSTVFKKDTIIYFHKDSLRNVLDYSKVEFIFSKDGTYQGKNNEGASNNGICLINMVKDSVTIDGTDFYLARLDSFNFISRGYSIQLADDQGNTDTAFTYLKLYPQYKITGTDHYLAAESIRLFPNPANDQFTIEAGSFHNEISEIRLLTIYGQLIRAVKAENASTLVIRTQDLPEGFYFVEIINKNGNRIAVKKISKKM